MTSPSPHKSNPVARAVTMYELVIEPAATKAKLKAVSEGGPLSSAEEFRRNLKAFAYKSLVDNAAGLAKRSCEAVSPKKKSSASRRIAELFTIDAVNFPDGKLNVQYALSIFGSSKIFARGFRDVDAMDALAPKGAKRPRDAAEDDVPNNPLFDLAFRKLFFAPTVESTESGVARYHGTRCDDSLARSSIGLALAGLDAEQLDWLEDNLLAKGVASSSSASNVRDSLEWQIVSDGFLDLTAALGGESQALAEAALCKCVGNADSAKALMATAAARTPTISAWELVATLLFPMANTSSDWLKGFEAKQAVTGVDDEPIEVISIASTRPQSLALNTPQASQQAIDFASADDIPSLMESSPNRLPREVVVAHRLPLSNNSISAQAIVNHYTAKELKDYLKEKGALPAPCPSAKADLASLILALKAKENK